MNKVMLIGNVGKDPDIHYFEASYFFSLQK